MDLKLTRFDCISFLGYASSQQHWANGDAEACKACSLILHETIPVEDLETSIELDCGKPLPHHGGKY